MSDAIIVAIITGVCSFLGVWVSNRRSASTIEYRLKSLEDETKKHNEVIARTYHLEERMSVVEERVKVANNRLSDLENAEKRN